MLCRSGKHRNMGLGWPRQKGHRVSLSFSLSPLSLSLALSAPNIPRTQLLFPGLSEAISIPSAPRLRRLRLTVSQHPSGEALGFRQVQPISAVPIRMQMLPPERERERETEMKLVYLTQHRGLSSPEVCRSCEFVRVEGER